MENGAAHQGEDRHRRANGRRPERTRTCKARRVRHPDISRIPAGDDVVFEWCRIATAISGEKSQRAAREKICEAFEDVLTYLASVQGRSADRAYIVAIQRVAP